MFENRLSGNSSSGNHRMQKPYTRSEIINSLVNEWEYICRENPPETPEEVDQTPEEYREELQGYSVDELLEEAWLEDKGITIDEYIQQWNF